MKYKVGDTVLVKSRNEIDIVILSEIYRGFFIGIGKKYIRTINNQEIICKINDLIEVLYE